jgi:hypothetical protein
MVIVLGKWRVRQWIYHITSTSSRSIVVAAVISHVVTRVFALPDLSDGSGSFSMYAVVWACVCVCVCVCMLVSGDVLVRVIDRLQIL